MKKSFGLFGFLCCALFLCFSLVVQADEGYWVDSYDMKTRITTAENLGYFDDNDHSPVKKVTDPKVPQKNKTFISLKCGSQTTIRINAKDNQKVRWYVLHDVKPNRDKIVTVKKNGKRSLQVKGFVPGKATVVVLIDDEMYLYKITTHTHGFQRQVVQFYVSRTWTPEKEARKCELSWSEIPGADGYVIYGTQYEKDPEKLKVIRNPNRTSWTYTLTQGKTNYLNFMIRGFKRTKSGIVLYTPYICGYMS